MQNEVIFLHTTIQELQDEAQTDNSAINHAGHERRQELGRILKNAMEALQELQQLIVQYLSLGTKQKLTWDRTKFGSESIQTIREKLFIHLSALSLFLADYIPVPSSVSRRNLTNSP